MSIDCRTAIVVWILLPGMVSLTGCTRAVPPPLEGPQGVVASDQKGREEQRRLAAERVQKELGHPQDEQLEEMRRLKREFVKEIKTTSFSFDYIWDYQHLHRFWYAVLTVKGDAQVPLTKPYAGKELGGIVQVRRIMADGSERSCGSQVFKLVPVSPGKARYEQGEVRIPHCKGGKFRVLLVLTTGLPGGQEIGNQEIELPVPPTEIPADPEYEAPQET